MSNKLGDMKAYSLKELAERTGLSERLIRDYIRREILPGPDSQGRNARYTDAHLDRLLCLQVLREATPPEYTLDMLRGVLNSLTGEQISDIGHGKEQVRALTMAGGEPHALHAKDFPLSQLKYSLVGDADESTLCDLVKRLESVTARQKVPRKAKAEWWSTVAITPDIEIRARGLNESDVACFERLADQLRHLLVKGVN